MHSEPAEPNPNLVSLVMATLGRGQEIDAMVQSLLAQSDRSFELIVVDQNRDERVRPFLKPLVEAGIAVKHVRLTTLGLSAARNAGIAEASGAIVAFPDDDCTYECDVIAKIRAAFRANASLEGVVGFWVERNQTRAAGPLDPAQWRVFSGGGAASICLFFRTARVRSAGGFCEHLGVGRYYGAGEEDDLIVRLLAAGARIDHVHDIRVHHAYSGRPKLSLQQCRRFRSYGRGTGAVLVKNRMPAWVIGRGFVGPFFHALRAPQPAAALVFGLFTTLGRIEGVLGWSLGRHQG